jgi:hypothetical protein
VAAGRCVVTAQALEGAHQRGLGLHSTWQRQLQLGVSTANMSYTGVRTPSVQQQPGALCTA